MLRVIIADDHPIVRIGQRVVIEADGKCKVVGEADGPDALLNMLDTTPCDLLVTDFAMPGGHQADGYVLLGLLKRQYPDLPVILVTMFANIATLRASFAQGARAIIAKSASAKELPLAIRAIRHGKTFVSESLRAQMDEAGTSDQSQQPQLSGKEREVVRMLASGNSLADALLAMIARAPWAKEARSVAILANIVTRITGKSGYWRFNNPSNT